MSICYLFQYSLFVLHVIKKHVEDCAESYLSLKENSRSQPSKDIVNSSPAWIDIVVAVCSFMKVFQN